MKLILGNWHLNTRIWHFNCRRLAFMKLTPGLNQFCFFFRTRLQWINAFRSAIENSGQSVRLQRALLSKRKTQREEDKEREEENMLRADSLDETRHQLEIEKLVKEQS